VSLRLSIVSPTPSVAGTGRLHREAMAYLSREYGHLSDGFAAEIDRMLELADYVQVVVRLAGFSIFRGSLTEADVASYLELEAAGLLEAPARRGLFGPGDVDEMTQAMVLYRDVPPTQWAADGPNADPGERVGV
jgi:hypothetical protein